jgi:hypothetical protein
MSEGEKSQIPTLGEKISEWFGVQLPSIPLPQTLRNLDKAIGKVVLATGENVEAHIKNRTGKIKAQGKIDIEGMYRTEEEKRKIENRAKATKAAIEELRQHPNRTDAAAEIEDDWLNVYSRLAEDKSSEELQNLFGRILAGEIRRPGSFSLRTLQILATISKDDAEKLSRLLSYALNGQIVPQWVGLAAGPTIAEQLFLQELGVASHAGVVGGMSLNLTVGVGESFIVAGSEHGIAIQNHAAGPVMFTIPGLPLTSSARELLTISRSPATDLGFLKYVAMQVYNQLQNKHKLEVESGSIVVSIGPTEQVDDKVWSFKTISTMPV